MCNSLTIKQTSVSQQSFLGLAAVATKKQLSGNEKEGDYLMSVEYSYGQGGSSEGVMGLQGGTVLKERKAKMEGS